MYRLLAQSLKTTVSADMPLKELICIFNALPTMFMLLYCLIGENDEPNLLEEAIDILTRMRNLIDFQEQSASDEETKVKISSLQQIWLTNAHELFCAIANQSNESQTALVELIFKMPDPVDTRI